MSRGILNTPGLKPRLPCNMCKTLTLVLTLFALLTPACSVPFYDLDAIAILGPTVAVDQATQAVARLGGVIGNGHTIVFDEQMAYCGKTATAETLAVASTMNVHLCPAYRTSSPSTQRRAVWHVGVDTQQRRLGGRAGWQWQCGGANGHGCSP